MRFAAASFTCATKHAATAVTDSTAAAVVESIVKIGESLRKEAIDNPSPSIDICQEFVTALDESTTATSNTGTGIGTGIGSMSMIALLEQSGIGKTLGKAIKAFKRHKRTEQSSSSSWNSLLDQSQLIVKRWKQTAETEAQTRTKAAKQKNAKLAPSSSSSSSSSVNKEGLPKTVAEYRKRLVQHNKDLYKDPPVLPLPTIAIDDATYGEPKRNKKTGELTFVPGQNYDEKTNALLRNDFRPNRTPQEVLRAGSFGGTYFRAIVSGVTNTKYNPATVLENTVHPSWIDGLDQSTMLTNATYKAAVNKFGVKCGGSLGMWESSGWISNADPYGWFQWYCRFYQGRRCDDDARQISRWCKSAGPRGRFRSQLCNKIMAANTHCGDRSISPVIRQTLLHWGLEITEHVLEQHKKRKK